MNGKSKPTKSETRANYEKTAAEAVEFHDFRDAGNPLEKLHPDPRHWSRWPERFDECEP